MPRSGPILLTPNTLVLLLTLLAAYPLLADQEVMTDDGREVLLKEDGTWEFRSNDRYANTKSGQRVRLKADASWEYVGNAPLTSKLQVRNTTLDIKLQKVVIEVHKEKVHKNIRTKTQTVFYLKLNATATAKMNATISKSDLSRILVKDDKGNRYPVISTIPSPVDLSPGSEQTISIRADGSPSGWSGARYLELEFSSGILGIQEPISLSQNISDIDRKTVDGFDNK